MVELSEEWIDKAQAKLANASKGKFFQTTEARLIPTFDRGNDAAAIDDELTLGKMLGEGAFCEVKEIRAIKLNNNDAGDGEVTSADLPSEHKGDTDEADFPVNLFQSKAEIRTYMSDNCLREDGTGSHSRYALKQLKPNNSQKHVEQGLIDLSIEAKFLANLNHPSIIRLRGLSGTPLTTNFGLVLDRLYMTLEDQMDAWTATKKESMSNGLCGCLGMGKMDEETRMGMLVSVVTAAYDLSCAMRYIHDQNLVYRDFKPENAGFDVRGDVKIFDFGFCKELTEDLFDKPSGQYKLTKRTGSQPYIAPENFVGKPYGKPSDVFSFGVLLWEMLHCKFAFYHLPNPKDYTDLVCNRDFRPAIDKSLPLRLQTIISESWDPDYRKRPTFKRLAIQLGVELRDMSSDQDALNRSEQMLDKSARSFRVNAKKKTTH